MKHDEFENQMFNHVNENCKMKELSREEIARAAQLEFIRDRKRKKINALIHLLAWGACFVAIIVALVVLNALGYIPAEIAISVIAVVGFVVGINSGALVRIIES